MKDRIHRRSTDPEDSEHFHMRGHRMSIRRWLEVASLVAAMSGGVRWAIQPLLELSTEVREQRNVNNDILFMVCPLYEKTFTGSPTPDRCSTRRLR